MSEKEATSPSHLDATHIVGPPFEAHCESPAGPAIYEHQALETSTNEIRLLRLCKEKEGPVHCELKTFPLELAPEYIALSYRWGPPSPLHDISIEGRTLKIRDILNSCLLELREDLDAWLWVDQICIAQADTTERNHQVGMMSRIYSESASVIIWLGDIPLAAPGEVDRFNDRYFDSASASLLFDNIYFTRLWIVQEIVLAKKVKLCINGHRCVMWSTLGDLKGTAYRSWGSSDFRAGYLVQDAKRYREGNTYKSLMELLHNYRRSRCKDPRDKVYGLMGLVRVEDRIAVDYKKTVAEVYVDSINSTINSAITRQANIDARYTLFELGFHMGLGWPLIRGGNALLEDRFLRRAHETVIAVGFEKADRAQEQEQDYWWCEYESEKCFYSQAPTQKTSTSDAIASE